jgi:hypothetical protein
MRLETGFYGFAGGIDHDFQGDYTNPAHFTGKNPVSKKIVGVVIPCLL